MSRPWQGIIGRGFTRDEFPIYLRENVHFDQWRPQFVVVHNTAQPTLAQWHTTSGATRMRNLEHFYKNEQGWSAGPHLFVADDLIWVFTPLTTHGIHSPSFNTRSWGVEIVGDYDRETFVGDVRANAIAALAALHTFAGLDPETMRWHKEDPDTTHDCPGRNVNKDEVIRAVRQAMREDGDHHPGAGASEEPSISSPSSQRLRSPLLSTVPFLEEVAAGRFVLAKDKTQPRDAVGAVQDAFNSLGQPAFSIDLGADNRHRGIYGPRTEQAVSAFQRAHQLDIDGKVGKDTIGVLDQVLVGAAPAPPPGITTPSALPDLADFPSGPSAGASVVSQRSFTTGPSQVSHRGNRSTTSGMRFVETIFSDGVIVVHGTEELHAHRDNRDLGSLTANQTWVKVNNLTRVHMQHYAYAGREFPDVWLFDEFTGFDSSTDVQAELASHFGKDDDVDEGTGSPWLGAVQTNSDVFGVALPRQTLHEFFGPEPRTNPALLQATVDVFNPATHKMARVPIVDVGPGASARAKIDLTMALDNYLGGTGMTPVQFRVNMSRASS